MVMVKLTVDTLISNQNRNQLRATSMQNTTTGVPEIHALSSRVGGHQGLLTSDDDSLIIKPTLPLEIAFYQRINGDAAFSPLQAFVPNFIGTLRLEGELIQRDGDIEPENIRTASDKADKP